MLPVAAFDDVDDVLDRANGTGFGLSAFVFTRDVGTALSVSKYVNIRIRGEHT